MDGNDYEVDLFTGTGESANVIVCFECQTSV